MAVGLRAAYQELPMALVYHNVTKTTWRCVNMGIVDSVQLKSTRRVCHFSCF